uniref:Uncharacterized protein n=1 Tax=Zea mays TaxID=4577 RepID=A0A804MV24_MAIZE
MASMAAGESGSSMRRRAWVVEVEKTLDEADASVEVSRWQLHSIYRVPACIKDLNRKAYKPQVVSLGPFHHRRDGELLPMEEHKKRALRHLLRRSKRPLEEFAAAVADVAGQLESAYLDLGAEWRGADGRERFLEMMIVDGCFLLEVIKATEMDGRNVVSDYAPNDPIFSHHGVLYMVPYIRRDMLMLENQLPLLLLEKLVAVQTERRRDQPDGAQVHVGVPIGAAAAGQHARAPPARPAAPEHALRPAAGAPAGVTGHGAGDDGHHPVGGGAVRGRDPVQEDQLGQPPQRAVPRRRAEHAGGVRGRLHRVHVPQHDGVRAAARRRRQRRHGLRLLHGQHHRLGQGRGAAQHQRHHPERRRQRQGGGPAVQQHLQGRRARAAELAGRCATGGQRLLREAVEPVARQSHPHLLPEPLGVHVPRRRRLPTRHDRHADRLHRAAILPAGPRQLAGGTGSIVIDLVAQLCCVVFTCMHDAKRRRVCRPAPCTFV